MSGLASCFVLAAAPELRNLTKTLAYLLQDWMEMEMAGVLRRPPRRSRGYPARRIFSMPHRHSFLRYAGGAPRSNEDTLANHTSVVVTI
jgi:hypothetical protein